MTNLAKLHFYRDLAASPDSSVAQPTAVAAEYCVVEIVWSDTKHQYLVTQRHHIQTTTGGQHAKVFEHSHE